MKDKPKLKIDELMAEILFEEIDNKLSVSTIKNKVQLFGSANVGKNFKLSNMVAPKELMIHERYYPTFFYDFWKRTPNWHPHSRITINSKYPWLGRVKILCGPECR